MIRIQQLKLRPDQDIQALEGKIRKELNLAKDVKFSYEVVRQSLDARKKPDIFYSYIADVSLPQEDKVLRRCKNNKNIVSVKENTFSFPYTCRNGSESELMRPVIIGSGPAGLFCALVLAKAGYRPIVLERGEQVDQRQKSVEAFWNGAALNEESNVQFGEGGAGTFSDGKLNTRIKDAEGRIQYVLKTFIAHGASSDIQYSYKPHIGTDVLAKVIPSIRDEIIQCGGEVRFTCCLKDLIRQQDGSYILHTLENKVLKQIHTRNVVLAIGHSSRDTIRMLYQRGMIMTPKAFAVGIRVQHKQSIVDAAMYGKECRYDLPPAPYAVTCKLPDGHGVYSFCMCPGGYVVNASSQNDHLAVNGMSYSDRGGENANSAIVVTVTPEDYEAKSPLDGVVFQQELERKAFDAGKGSIPLQRFEDFCENRITAACGGITPALKGNYTFANLRNVFPEAVNEAIITGMHAFAKQIPGFDDGDTLLCAVESRTSAPVRMERNEKMQAPGFDGVFPCGEGAGYAGGIVSSAVDGLRVAAQCAAKIDIDFQSE